MSFGENHSVCKLSLNHMQKFNLIRQSGWNTPISAQSKMSAYQFQTIMTTFMSISNDSSPLIIRFLSVCHCHCYRFT